MFMGIIASIRGAYESMIVDCYDDAFDDGIDEFDNTPAWLNKLCDVVIHADEITVGSIIDAIEYAVTSVSCRIGIAKDVTDIISIEQMLDADCVRA